MILRPLRASRTITIVSTLVMGFGVVIGSLIVAHSANATTPAPVVAVKSAFASPLSLTNSVQVLSSTVDASGNSYFLAGSSLFSDCGEGFIEVSTTGTVTKQNLCYDTGSTHVSADLMSIQWATIAGTPSLIVANDNYIWVLPTTATGGTTTFTLSNDLYGYNTLNYGGVFYDSANDTMYVSDLTGGFGVKSFTDVSQCVATPQTGSCATANAVLAGTGADGGPLTVAGNNVVFAEETATTPSHAEICSGPLTGTGAQTPTCSTLASSLDTFGPVTTDNQGNVWLVAYNSAVTNPTSGGLSGSLYELPAGATSAVPVTLSPSNLVYAPQTLAWSDAAPWHGGLLALDTADFYSATQHLWVMNPVPATPTGVSATTPSGGSTTISWSAASGAARYVVTASPGSSTCSIAAPSTSCSLTGLSAGTYHVSVVSTSAASIASSPSSSITVVVASSPTTTSSTTSTTSKPTPLPDTGSPLGIIALLGAGLLSAGAVLGLRRKGSRI